MAKISGTVKWFNETKGFGFINSGGKDYFVHFANIEGSGFKTLVPDQKVTFEKGDGPKGPTALKVEAIKDSH